MLLRRKFKSEQNFSSRYRKIAPRKIAPSKLPVVQDLGLRLGLGRGQTFKGHFSRE